MYSCSCAALQPGGECCVCAVRRCRECLKVYGWYESAHDGDGGICDDCSYVAALKPCVVAHKHWFSEPVGLDWRCRYCGASMGARGWCRVGPFCRGGPRWPKRCEQECARVDASCNG